MYYIRVTVVQFLKRKVAFDGWKFLKNNAVIFNVIQVREARKSRISKEPSEDGDYIKIILQHQNGKIGRRFDKAALFQVNIYFT